MPQYARTREEELLSQPFRPRHIDGVEPIVQAAIAAGQRQGLADQRWGGHWYGGDVPDDTERYETDATRELRKIVERGRAHSANFEAQTNAGRHFGGAVPHTNRAGQVHFGSVDDGRVWDFDTDDQHMATPGGTTLERLPQQTRDALRQRSQANAVEMAMRRSRIPERKMGLQGMNVTPSLMAAVQAQQNPEYAKIQGQLASEEAQGRRDMAIAQMQAGLTREGYANQREVAEIGSRRPQMSPYEQRLAALASGVPVEQLDEFIYNSQQGSVGDGVTQAIPAVAPASMTMGGLVKPAQYQAMNSLDPERKNRPAVIRYLREQGLPAPELNKILRAWYGDEYMTANDPSGMANYLTNPLASVTGSFPHLPDQIESKGLLEAVRHLMLPKWGSAPPITLAK